MGKVRRTEALKVWLAGPVMPNALVRGALPMRYCFVPEAVDTLAGVVSAVGSTYWIAVQPDWPRPLSPALQPLNPLGPLPNLPFLRADPLNAVFIDGMHWPEFGAALAQFPPEFQVGVNGEPVS